MDWELIWWIGAAVVSYFGVFLLLREPKHEDIYDPYRYCPKDED